MKTTQGATVSYGDSLVICVKACIVFIYLDVRTAGVNPANSQIKCPHKNKGKWLSKEVKMDSAGCECNHVDCVTNIATSVEVRILQAKCSKC